MSVGYRAPEPSIEFCYAEHCRQCQTRRISFLEVTGLVLDLVQEDSPSLLINDNPRGLPIKGLQRQSLDFGEDYLISRVLIFLDRLLES